MRTLELLKKKGEGIIAWCWARNEFWFKKIHKGSFVDEWWKENFRIFRNIFQFIIRLVGPDLAKEETTAQSFIR